jgi:crotonobetainyl-CoA:carnitine CoA-transferase CaiB-like acyl-CoA transferase
MHNTTELMLASILEALDADPRIADCVLFSGRRAALPSPFAVSAFAAASAAAATLGVAALHAARSGGPPPAVDIDHLHAATAFCSERRLRGDGFSVPVAWDPLAGDYLCKDGFIRLHTNYPWHRAAALGVLGVPAQRERIAEATALWTKAELEARVVAAGGAAAAAYSEEEFASSPVGMALRKEPLVGRLASGSALPLERAALPLAGVRVLDLTRVLAGPVCTRVLAAWGADVLRIDPPGFPEVEALLGDTTWGKRRAALALDEERGRAQLECLIAAADVLVLAYRPTALAHLRLSPETLRAKHPGLVIVQINAYGFDNPWAERRGFDSLVQMSTGIAARGALVAGSARPVPLPAQALDHGTGYLAAAAATFGLVERVTQRSAPTLRLSLARTATFLTGHGHHEASSEALTDTEAAPFMVRVDTDFGPMQRVRVPGGIAGFTSVETVPAGPLGIHPAAFLPR